MRLAAPALTAALLAPAAALAQPPQVCQTMISQVAQTIPDQTDTSDAAEQLNVSEEQLEAALAALDAARIVKDTDTGGCLTMVNAARTVLARGSAAIPEGARPVTDLEGWNYKALYENAWRANAVMDAPVYNPDGQEVGEVEDIVMRPDGTLTGLIVEANGFLDIGDQHVRVAWDEVRFRGEGQRGVVAPLDKGNVAEAGLFEDDVEIGAQRVRMSALLNETVRLKTGAPYGYVYDVLVTDGKVKATVLRPDIAYAGRREPFAAPYYAYEYGFSPGYDFYLLPYDREQLERVEGFDVEKVGQPGEKAQTQ